jgi:predicted kinase
MPMRIIVLIGLPGSGKSTYLERMGVTGLSSDRIRQWLTDDETDQSVQRRVFRTLRYLLRERLEIGRPVTYIDATNLTPRERRPYLVIAQKRGCTAEAVFFDLPLEVCRQRNLSRARVVPDDVLLRMAERLTPPTQAEGFARITVIRV